jgi:hypothetical protein
MKTTLNGKRFQDAEHVKKSMTAELNAVPFDAFADCFQNRLEQLEVQRFFFYFLVFVISF